MARKVTDGNIYNKERTKQKLLEAVGKILRTKGFESLNVSTIAKAAGVDRKLIYVYFDNLDNLVETYIKNNDYWQSFTETLQDLLAINRKDYGEQISTFIPQLQFEYLLKSKEVQKIILWDLSQKNQVLKTNSLKRENILSSIFEISDPLFKNTEIDFRAIQALIIGGIYYLTLQSVSNGIPFCEIDINKEIDKLRINKTIEFLMKLLYREGIQQKKLLEQ